MPEYTYPGDAIALQQWGVSPRLCSCDRSVDAPHSSQCPFWQDVLAARIAWVKKLWPTEAVEDLCTKPDTLVRWMTEHTWRCACTPPADLNSAGAYTCQDCGTLRPQKKDPSKMSNGYDRTRMSVHHPGNRTFIPEYLCHKRVRALQIEQVVRVTDQTEPAASLFFKDPLFAPTTVRGPILMRYYPEAGDYYVVYEDGYVSFSPRKAFEDGYTLVGNVAPRPPEPPLYGGKVLLKCGCIDVCTNQRDHK